MKRTKFTSARKQRNYEAIEDMKIARKIAWTFNATTGIDFEELYSEAIVTYYESRTSFNAEKGMKFTSWAWLRMRNALIDYCANIQGKKMSSLDDIKVEPISYPTNGIEYLDSLNTLSTPARTVIEKIFNAPQIYLAQAPKLTRGIISKELLESGYTQVQTWDTIRELKQFINA